MPVLDPGRGRTKTGQLWAYAADDRHGRPAPIRRPSPISMPRPQGRSTDGHLAGSGYAGYGKLAERGDVQLASCWS
ncbi:MULTISPECIES: IS66 family transposase [Bradyrhizobium]|uniref:Transposase n=1 Tax=Bradyrhizobium barranii subsp. barranii TaxID=2823807 RepID=A0A939M207_9BRAD